MKYFFILFFLISSNLLAKTEIRLVQTEHWMLWPEFESRLKTYSSTFKSATNLLIFHEYTKNHNIGFVVDCMARPNFSYLYNPNLAKNDFFEIDILFGFYFGPNSKKWKEWDYQYSVQNKYTHQRPSTLYSGSWAYWPILGLDFDFKAWSYKNKNQKISPTFTLTPKFIQFGAKYEF